MDSLDVTNREFLLKNKLYNLIKKNQHLTCPVFCFSCAISFFFVYFLNKTKSYQFLWPHNKDLKLSKVMFSNRLQFICVFSVAKIIHELFYWDKQLLTDCKSNHQLFQWRNIKKYVYFWVGIISFVFSNRNMIIISMSYSRYKL